MPEDELLISFSIAACAERASCEAERLHLLSLLINNMCRRDASIDFDAVRGNRDHRPSM